MNEKSLYFFCCKIIMIKREEDDKNDQYKKKWKGLSVLLWSRKDKWKRKQITKSGFKTKNEVYTAGQRVYDEFINGVSSTERNMLYSDYLDYWMKKYWN